MAEQKRISAIVRGPNSYFGQDGVLYPAGSLIEFDPERPETSGIPAGEVSDKNTRVIELECRDRREKWTEKKTVRVQFRPVPDGSSATSPEEKKTDNSGAFNAGKFLSANAPDIAKKIEAGAVDDFLSVLETAENAKGKPRAGVVSAIKARTEALSAG